MHSNESTPSEFLAKVKQSQANFNFLIDIPKLAKNWDVIARNHSQANVSVLYVSKAKGAVHAEFELYFNLVLTFDRVQIVVVCVFLFAGSGCLCLQQENSLVQMFTCSLSVLVILSLTK